MEPNRQEIEDIMRRNGLEENEALARYHLRRAEQLFTELYSTGEDDPAMGLISHVRNEMSFGVHFRVLNRLLALRVVQRDYPEGWGSTPEPQEES